MRNTINAKYYDDYTISQMKREAGAEAVEDFKRQLRRKAIKKAEKRRQLKQMLCFKALSLICLIGGLAILFVDPAEGSAAVACITLGLFGLVVPFNATFTW